MKNLGGGGGKEGSERREGRWGGNKEGEGTGERERSQIEIKKIYVLTKSESMTSTTLYSHDTASQCVHPVLPTLLGTVYAHVHVLI